MQGVVMDLNLSPEPLKSSEIEGASGPRATDQQMDGPINWPTDIEACQKSFQTATPFNHIVIDNFFREDIALQLERDFPDFDSPVWYVYNNAIEKKRALNSWDRFPRTTYQIFNYLNSAECLEHLSDVTGIRNLNPDIGLNGGGWHAHKRGGKLNVHLDYSIHPKLLLERRLNLIVYLSREWNPQWGGGLQLWSHDDKREQPKELAKTVDVKFNRGVLFDTTQNSWHGLPDELDCPEGHVRKSLAIYYLTPPRVEASERGKALFAPHKDAENDPEVLELIRKRSEVKTADTVYRK
jgi:Rps23 Pro-64 3,4-dihydroxylase Tpa1-like proline 4-hydroxylase